MYQVFVKSKVRKYLKKIDHSDVEKILLKIKNLQVDPQPRGSKKLINNPALFRIRQGDHRMIYTIDEYQKKIIILRANHRNDVYKKR